MIHLQNSIGLLYLRSFSMSHFVVRADIICAKKKAKGDSKTKLNTSPELVLEKNSTTKAIRPAAKTITKKTIEASPNNIDITAKPIYLCLLLIVVFPVNLFHYHYHGKTLVFLTFERLFLILI